MRLHYTYDDANRRIGLALPDGQQQSWGYDPAGRVNGVIQPGGGSWTVAHNGAGQPTMASVPSGGSQVWGYDPAGRPVSATWLQGGNPTFSQVATLDPAGQRKGLADSWGTVTYGYDRAGRLTSAGYPDGSTEADTYDPAGNRTTITATTPLSGTAVTTNSYDAADQLSTAATAGGPQPGTTTYVYDGNGNQTGSSGPSGTTSNTFNNLNQLAHIVGPGTNLTLLYDGQGDRLRSYERGTPTWTLRNEAQDLAGGLSALVSDGTADYAYLSPGDGSAPLSSYTPATSRATYLATDLLGSVRLATDPTGAAIGAGAYDAWGNARPYTGTGGATGLAGLQGVAPFGYAGQQRDAGPGTYAMRARRYDPTQGRFQSQDTLLPNPGLVPSNPYTYGDDRPTSRTDPSGKSPIGSSSIPLHPGNSVLSASSSDTAPAQVPGALDVSGDKGERAALHCAIELYRHEGYTIYVGPGITPDEQNTNIAIGRLEFGKSQDVNGADFIAYKWTGMRYRLVAVEVKYTKKKGGFGSSNFKRRYPDKTGPRAGSLAWAEAASKANCRSTSNSSSLDAYNSKSTMSANILGDENCFWLHPENQLQLDAAANGHTCKPAPDLYDREVDFVGMSGYVDSSGKPSPRLRPDIINNEPWFTYTTMFGVDGKVVSDSAVGSHALPGSSGFSCSGNPPRKQGIAIECVEPPHVDDFWPGLHYLKVGFIAVAVGAPGEVKDFKLHASVEAATADSQLGDVWSGYDSFDQTAHQSTMIFSYFSRHFPSCYGNSKSIRIRFKFPKNSDKRDPNVTYVQRIGTATLEGAYWLDQDVFLGPFDVKAWLC